MLTSFDNVVTEAAWTIYNSRPDLHAQFTDQRGRLHILVDYSVLALHSIGADHDLCDRLRGATDGAAGTAWLMMAADPRGMTFVVTKEAALSGYARDTLKRFTDRMVEESQHVVQSADALG